MKLPFTRKMLEAWGGPQVLLDADRLVADGRVVDAVHAPPYLRGTILWNNRELATALLLRPDGTVESQCPCYANRERGLVCAHVIALGVTLIKRATDPLREEKYRAERRRAERLAAVDEAAYLRRVPASSPGAVPAGLRVVLPADWQPQCRAGRVTVRCDVEWGGQRVPVDQVGRQLSLSFSKQDESILFVLEDVAEGPARHALDLNRFDFINLLRLHSGLPIEVAGADPLAVRDTKMTTFLRMDLDRENGELILMAHTELPFMRGGEFPFYVVSGASGWVYGAGSFWPLANVLPLPYHPIYEEPVVLSRPEILRFLRQELPNLAQHARVESDLSLDLFTLDRERPEFHLAVRGSPASLSATLWAVYGDVRVVAGRADPRGDFAHPDPRDLMRFTVRHPEAEAAALERAAAAGFRGPFGDELSSIVGQREVLNFLGGRLPALRRLGWRVDVEGRAAALLNSADFATPVVQVSEGSGGDWFDVGFDFEDGAGQSISQAEIQLALRKGDAFFTRGGRTVLIDADAVESMQDVFADCASGEASERGRFRLAGVHASFVKASLDSLDGVDIEVPAGWRDQSDLRNRVVSVEPVPLDGALDRALRPYQKEGVNWLRFLEKQNFCGLLADEMGLGKTVQALAWIQLQRLAPRAQNRPALVVCPTSLVDSWAEEAARFAPGLRVLTLTGSDRHEKWPEAARSDLVVTSYALLRRDIQQYAGVEFAAMILDEAQHIKNRSTQNALAAKQVRAVHRLVLTGTPVENSVSDLWSIMDFLMPGYLGTHDAFRQRYETAIGRGGPDAETANARLRRKLKPFLLRRMKSDVARDLPPKIEKTSFCALTADQRAVYRELLEASRRKITGLMAHKGLNGCRMEILATLMRLRQACCHLELLKLPGLRPEQPSAKLDLFFELLDEALDSEHRLLVFSQFVSMLTILRRELDQRSLAYCYLDGSTKDRLQVVHRFNTAREVPVFLISLKAGGTGLNLTGADMVIHFDPWWNPAVEDQATDRAYRIGQKRTVYSHKLITRGTVEEKVLALQQRKRAVIDATIASDEKRVESLSWEDVQELLSL